MPRSSVTRVFIAGAALLIPSRALHSRTQSGRGLGAFSIERLEIDIGLTNKPKLARNSQTSMTQDLDQPRQLAPLEILESAAAGECGHYVPVVIENGTSNMAMFVGRLLVVDREPVCPARFDGGDELRGLGDRMRGDRVHSLAFDELENLCGCEIAAP